MKKEKTTNIKKEKTPKKNRGKTALKVISIILAVIIILGVAGTIVNKVGCKAQLENVNNFKAVEYKNQLVPQMDDGGVWTFTTDKKFRIMQLTDIHIGAGWMSTSKDTMALNAVASMITAEKPDLVIVTGDIVYPVPFQAGTFNNLSGAEIVANLMENLGVYWLPVFGNHDTEIYATYDRKEITEFYASGEFEHCLLNKNNINDGVDGYSNTIINIKTPDGLISQTLYTFDTHSYVDNDYLGIGWKYDNIHSNQIEWYKKNVEKYISYNNELIEKLYPENTAYMKSIHGTPRSLAFMHVPTTEYLDTWNCYVNSGYKDAEGIRYYYGTVGETGKLVYHGVYPDQLVETMIQLKSTQGIFCGHDHLNNFSISYNGIRLTYGLSIDYLAYSGISKLGSQRGCTMITVSPDGTFDCVAENYYQDKYTSVSENVKEEVTMQVLNENTK